MAGEKGFGTPKIEGVAVDSVGKSCLLTNIGRRIIWPHKSRLWHSGRINHSDSAPCPRISIESRYGVGTIVKIQENSRLEGLTDG
jgi:hypothetical protein